MGDDTVRKSAALMTDDELSAVEVLLLDGEAPKGPWAREADPRTAGWGVCVAQMMDDNLPSDIVARIPRMGKEEAIVRLISRYRTLAPQMAKAFQAERGRAERAEEETARLRTVLAATERDLREWRDSLPTGQVSSLLDALEHARRERSVAWARAERMERERDAEHAARERAEAKLAALSGEHCPCCEHPGCCGLTIDTTEHSEGSKPDTGEASCVVNGTTVTVRWCESPRDALVSSVLASEARATEAERINAETLELAERIPCPIGSKDRNACRCDGCRIVAALSGPSRKPVSSSIESPEAIGSIACAWCGDVAGDALTVVARSGVGLCDSCVDRAARIVADERALWTAARERAGLAGEDGAQGGDTRGRTLAVPLAAPAQPADSLEATAAAERAWCAATAVAQLGRCYAAADAAGAAACRAIYDAICHPGGK